MKAHETIKGRAGLRAKIIQDEVDCSPADNQDGGLFLISGHRDFYVPAPDEKDVRPDFADYVAEFGESHWVFPVEAYIHGGVSLALSGRGNFPDRQWDVSQCGAIFASKSEWPLRESAEKAARGLVEYWNQYLSGDVWGVVIEDRNGEHVDSCWGYYGLEYARQEAAEMLKQAEDDADRIPTLKAIGGEKGAA